MKYNLTLLSQAAGMFSQSSATLSLHNPVMIPISFLLNIYCPFSRQIKLAICSISAFVLFIIRAPFREYSKTLIFCEKHPLLHTNLESYAKVLRIEKPTGFAGRRFRAFQSPKIIPLYPALKSTA